MTAPILYPYQRRYLVKLLSAAARAAAEASRASIGQKRWAGEVRAKLDALEAEQSKGSKRLDAETLARVR